MKNSIEEYVKISLDRYNDFVNDQKKANIMSGVFYEMKRIINDDSFGINKNIDKKIFNLYERLCKQI